MMHDHNERAESRTHHDHAGRHGLEGDRRRQHHPEGPGAARGRRRFGGGPQRGEGRGRGRAQRGDVRAASLLLLAEGPMHGYQLMQAITARTNGAWRPSPGAIYPAIALLEDEGLVAITPSSGRKLVTLSEAGREYLATNADTVIDPFTAITEQAGGDHNLRGGVEQVRDAARAVGQSGNEAQIAAAQQILGQAKRALYLILAEDTEPTAGETPAEQTT